MPVPISPHHMFLDTSITQRYHQDCVSAERDLLASANVLYYLFDPHQRCTHFPQQKMEMAGWLRVSRWVSDRTKAWPSCVQHPVLCFRSRLFTCGSIPWTWALTTGSVQLSLILQNCFPHPGQRGHGKPRIIRGVHKRIIFEVNFISLWESVRSDKN